MEIDLQAGLDESVLVEEDFKRKDIWAGICDQLTWIILLWSALLIGLIKMGSGRVDCHLMVILHPV